MAVNDMRTAFKYGISGLAMLFGISGTPATPGTAFNAGVTPVTKGLIETNNDTVALQAFLDFNAGKLADFQPSVSRFAYRLKGPLKVPQGTVFDGNGAWFEADLDFVGTLMPAYNSATAYGVASLTPPPVITVANHDNWRCSMLGRNFFAQGATTGNPPCQKGISLTLYPSSGDSITINGQPITVVNTGAAGMQVNRKEVDAVTNKSLSDILGQVKAVINANPGAFNVTAADVGTSPQALSLSTITGGVNVLPTLVTNNATNWYVCAVMTSLTYWKPAPQGSLFEADDRASTVSEPSQTGTLEYNMNRSVATAITVKNVNMSGRRLEFPGWSNDLTTNTSPMIGGILKNSTVDSTALSNSNFTQGVDTFWNMDRINCYGFSGYPFYFHGRGGGFYTNLRWEDNTYGMVIDEYDSHFSNLEGGNTGEIGLTLLRENSRDLTIIGGKIWYGGTYVTTPYKVTSTQIDDWRRLTLGEPVMVDNTSKLQYSYGSASATQLGTLTEPERQQREAAYIAGQLVSATTTWTSGGNAAHAGTGLAAATGTLTFTGVPAVNDKLTLLGTDLTFRTTSGNANEVGITGLVTGSDVATAVATAINANRINWPLSAAAVGNVVTVTARASGACGNDISTKVKTNTAGFLAVGQAKLTGGTGAAAFTGSGTTAANPNAPNGLSWSTKVRGQNIRCEGSDIICIIRTQDGWGGEVLDGGKGNWWLLKCAQGPVQPVKKYWNRDVFVLTDLGFSDSGNYTTITGNLYDQGNPAMRNLIRIDVNAKNLEINIKSRGPTADMVAGGNGIVRTSGKTLGTGANICKIVVNNVDLTAATTTVTY